MTQDKDALVSVLHKGRHAIATQIGVDGYSIRSPHLEGGPGVGLGSGAYVRQLGVEDHRHMGPLVDVADGLLQRFQSGQTQCFVEGEVGLVGTDNIGGLLDDPSVEGQHLTARNQLRSGVQTYAQQAVILIDGYLQFLKE